VLRYIELKTGHSDNGPAWIARVKLSKSGRTVYFNGRALKRSNRGGIEGNHFDIRTNEEYWVSGVKKDGLDRHWAGSGAVAIEASAVAEYLQEIGAAQLDRRRFRVISDLPETDPTAFDDVVHARLHE
jgi:hypothetical protein